MAKSKHGGRRNGAGRPELGRKAKSVVLRFMATPADAKRWRREAEVAGKTLSELIRERMEAF